MYINYLTHWIKHSFMVSHILLIVSLGLFSFQTADPLNEYKLKAVFIYNFTHFVEWPQHTLQQNNSPFVIGILGKDPFGNYLIETIQNEKLRDHPLIMRQFKDVDEIDSCHILFIDEPEENKMDEILSKLKGKSVLTVGDRAGFAENGGMIQLLTVDNKIRIQVNLNACKSAGLNVSSKLLRIVTIVDSQNE